MPKVFVSGCFDLLHSGHIRFFEEAAEHGDVYVSVGSDKTVMELKHRPTVFPEQERLFMVQSIKFVHQAFIGSGSGYLDFLAELTKIQPDIFFVNADGDSPEKRDLCQKMGIQYIVSQRIPKTGLTARSTTALREQLKK